MSDSTPSSRPSPDVQIDDGHVEDDLGAAATLPSAREQKRAGRGGGGGDDGGSGGGSGGAKRRRVPLPTGLASVAVVLIVVLLLAAVPIVWSTLEKTPRDKVGISYGGGPIEGAHFQRIVQPGSGLFFNGLADNLYLYPADQRNYIVSTNKGEGDNPDTLAITAPSKDQVQIGYQVAVYYKLNTDKLRQFHEQIGLKYSAYTTDGWNELIGDTFRQQIENALQEQTRRFKVAELFGDREVLLQLQSEVESSLSSRLERALGGNYFCNPDWKPGEECKNPTFVVKRIDIPQNLAKAFVDERTARVDVARREAEAEGINAIADALEKAGEDYVRLKAIESGKVTFWILPDGGITVTAPDGSTGTGAPSSPDGGGSGG